MLENLFKDTTPPPVSKWTERMEFYKKEANGDAQRLRQIEIMEKANQKLRGLGIIDENGKFGPFSRVDDLKWLLAGVAIELAEKPHGLMEDPRIDKALKELFNA